MVGVHLSIEQIDAVHLHGVDDGVNAGLVAPFGKVRYTFYECWHKIAVRCSPFALRFSPGSLWGGLFSKSLPFLVWSERRIAKSEQRT
jgi:hypothetical protein